MRTRGPKRRPEAGSVAAVAAYTAGMNTVFWRAVIAALLVLALPLQALAGLRLCGMAAGPVMAMAPLAVEASAPKAAPEAMPPCHEMAVADRAVASDSADTEADSAADSDAGTRCSVCAASACCHAPALLPSLPSLRLPAQTVAPVSAPAAARERMLTGGLDRPPRLA